MVTRDIPLRDFPDLLLLCGRDRIIGSAVFPAGPVLHLNKADRIVFLGDDIDFSNSYPVVTLQDREPLIRQKAAGFLFLPAANFSFINTFFLLIV